MIINHYAGSPKFGMEYRPYYLAKEWAQLSHSVTIVSASYSHLRIKNPISGKSEEIIDGVRYVWIRTPKYRGNGLKRIVNILWFSWNLFVNAKLFTDQYNPDIVIASSTYPIDNFAAHRIAKLAGAKHIFEVHDLWPLTPMKLKGMSKFHPFILVMQYIEDYAYKMAHSVVSMLPDTKPYMVSRGLLLEKWNYIPNGISVSEWDQGSNLPRKYIDLFDSFKTTGKTIIGYAGGHSISNSLETILSAARELSVSNKYKFVFVGDGERKNDLIQNNSDLEHVVFLDPITKSQIPAFLDQMDILILAWQDSELYQYGISPNKIFDYLMSGKPIIHAVKTPTDIVNIAQAGISVEPNNPTAIVNAIKTLAELSPGQLIAMGLNGHKYVINNHSYTELARTFLSIMEELS